MSSDIVIRVENLSKKYALGQRPNGADAGLRHALQNAATAPWRMWKNRKPKAKIGNSAFNFPLSALPPDSPPSTFSSDSPPPLSTSDFQLSTSETSVPSSFWALKDVSFEVKRGEVLGIIGRNGAGKSTLLKVLSRITEPTTGRIGTNGRIASLLEVGTGFHPELTGRENVYLNGAILGMTRSEVSRKFDEIVAFAEVEKFLDTPVKRYSSGMYVRLAFAIAAHLEPDILVVDEVLAVGDAEFQTKCLGKLQNISRFSGRTVLFVSHNETAIRRLCTSAILLKRGMIQMKDDVRTVLTAYRDDFQSNQRQVRKTPPNAKLFIRSVRMWVGDVEMNTLAPNSRVSIEMQIDVFDRVEFTCEFLLKGQSGQPFMFGAPGFTQGTKHSLELGSSTLAYEIALPNLADGIYAFDVMLANPTQFFYDYWTDCISFNCTAPVHVRSGWKYLQSRGQGAAMLPCHQVDSRHIPLRQNPEIGSIP